MTGCLWIPCTYKLCKIHKPIWQFGICIFFSEFLDCGRAKIPRLNKQSTEKSFPLVSDWFVSLWWFDKSAVGRTEELQGSLQAAPFKTSNQAPIYFDRAHVLWQKKLCRDYKRSQAKCCSKPVNLFAAWWLMPSSQINLKFLVVWNVSFKDNFKGDKNVNYMKNTDNFWHSLT